MKKILALVTSIVILTGCTTEASEPPKPQPSFALSTAGGDPNLCKFEEVSAERNQAPERLGFSYFPPAKESNFFLPTAGKWKVGLVLLDWSDMAGGDGDKKYYFDQSKQLSKWYDTSSNGRIKIDWRLSSKWSRLKGQSKDYYAPDNTAGSDEARQSSEQKLLDLAVAATDSSFDYSGFSCS